MTERNTQIHVRVPPDLKADVERLALSNRRTVNSEIVFGLEFYVSQTQQKEKAPEHGLENRSDASQK